MNYEQIQKISKELQKVETKREKLKEKYALDFDKLNCEIEVLQDELAKVIYPSHDTQENNQ